MPESSPRRITEPQCVGALADALGDNEADEHDAGDDGPRDIPYCPRPALNSRGKPWSSVGKRNLSISKPGCGNGNVPPPQYERRRSGLPSCEINNAFYMGDWRICVDTALRLRLISRALHSVLHILGSFSSYSGEHVTVAQSEIGNRANLGTDYVNHLLRGAREVGLLDWVQEFEPVGNGLAIPRSCTYAFTMPIELVMAAKLKKRLKTMKEQHGPGTGRRVGKPINPPPSRNERETYDPAKLDQDRARKDDEHNVDRIANQQGALASNTSYRQAEEATDEALCDYFAPRPVPPAMRERAIEQLNAQWRKYRASNPDTS